jgi:tRNA-splicing ligase RtcB (3'-phosphate/5'-hydroxy nucleic acid ligase)
MGKSKLKGKDLRKIGYQSDTAKSIAIDLFSKHYKHLSKDEKLEILQKIKEQPEDYAGHEILAKLAHQFMEVVKSKEYTSYKLTEEPKPFRVFGKKFIDQNTINQMEMAMRLPVAKNGALMPDAHVGYGLPIGGVLATENELIPYGVGLDIGCRMSLSIYEVPPNFLKKYAYQLKMALKEHTHFGIKTRQAASVEHHVLDRPEFKETELLRQLQGKAAMQIGSSGSGNHFVEFGELIFHDNNTLQIQPGNYLGILSHSGSRGFGATVAQYYTRLAMDLCRLPKGTQNLAWLSLDSAEGQEYWRAMNLAGDYAKACHDVIHSKLAKVLKLKPVLTIENHHNFAWKELQADGRELIVHRKGATPAKAGELGIIPGSMTAPGYIVSGLGNADSLNSASHGAGRRLSRKKARESVTGSALKTMLKAEGVTLIGGGLDEAPIAYKNIDEVIKYQSDMVKVEGVFKPKIVRMDKP